MQSESITELMGALNRAQLAMIPAKRENENPFFHSKYADLATVWDALHPFRAEGIVFTQCPVDSPDEYMVLETQLTHAPSGQWIRSTLKMRAVKSDPQAAGSCLTYMRRYSLSAMTGLVSELDDDANGAMPVKPPQGKTFEQKFPAKPTLVHPAPKPTPPASVPGVDLGQDLADKIALAQSVAECAAVGNEIEDAIMVSDEDKRALRVMVSQRLTELTVPAKAKKG
jgi:hypothetical protein